MGTGFTWHIVSCHTGIGLYLLRVKIRVITLRADIMRRQGIYLGNMGHGGGKGGTYGTSGAYQIAVLIGLIHQLLGNNIHHGITVGDNGI